MGGILVPLKIKLLYKGYGKENMGHKQEKHLLYQKLFDKGFDSIATSYALGHLIYSASKYDDTISQLNHSEWKYSDGSPFDDSRPCMKCNCYPTKEGYDACLGYIEGAEHACCGHGVEEDRYIIYKEEKKY